MTLAPCWTAYCTACTIPEIVPWLVPGGDLQDQERSARGGAHDPDPAAGRGQVGGAMAGLTYSERLYALLPWAAIELASPNASAPSVLAAVPSSEKSWYRGDHGRPRRP